MHERSTNLFKIWTEHWILVKNRFITTQHATNVVARHQKLIKVAKKNDYKPIPNRLIWEGIQDLSVHLLTINYQSLMVNVSNGWKVSKNSHFEVENQWRSASSINLQLFEPTTCRKWAKTDWRQLLENWLIGFRKLSDSQLFFWLSIHLNRKKREKEKRNIISDEQNNRSIFDYLKPINSINSNKLISIEPRLLTNGTHD